MPTRIIKYFQIFSDFGLSILAIISDFGLSISAIISAIISANFGHMYSAWQKVSKHVIVDQFLTNYISITNESNPIKIFLIES
jgi:uncharacterized membrane protein YjjB (DUF3815 family)